MKLNAAAMLEVIKPETEEFDRILSQLGLSHLKYLSQPSWEKFIMTLPDRDIDGFNQKLQAWLFDFGSAGPMELKLYKIPGNNPLRWARTAYEVISDVTCSDSSNLLMLAISNVLAQLEER
ncbi:hypothetical protein [Ammoniphilus resinae]|uniref:Uncharacterized protein n=1 Tax=Ammoniphilus resinae TaxID=861532 RepID=A0ABS4GPR3_9BACL|nr:hypothetical protein [Ammoniphilus resinae]MBP1932047.1 hypothetical protein [Ammoniphilus resinae]